MTWNNRVIITVVFLFVSICAKAQVSGTINYKLTIVDPALSSTSTINSVLYINDNKSLQVNLGKDIKPQEVDENTRIDVFKGRTKFVLKDFKKKTLLLSDNIVVKTYLISDTLLNFKWSITKEKRKISNFTCTKALLNFRGRSYIAWFANDIPIQNGPWKFCGLPGLIIKINDDKNIFTYELTGIDLKTKLEKNIVSIPVSYSKDQPITHKEYFLLLNKKALDFEKMAKVVHTGKTGGWSSGTVVLPTKQEKF